MRRVTLIKYLGPVAGLAVLIGVPQASADVSIGRASVDGRELNRVFIDAPGSTQAGDVAVGAGHIFWINGNSIGRADLDGLNVDPQFITGLSEPSGLSANDRYVFWGGDSIGRAGVDGTDVEGNLIPSAGEADDVAANSQYLYWTSAEGIGRANLDGTAADPGFIDTGVPATPTSPGVNPPTQVAVNATNVYWVDTAYDQGSATSNIARSSLDGSGAVETIRSSSYVFHGDVFGPLGADDTYLFARVSCCLGEQEIRSIGVGNASWPPIESPTAEDSFDGGIALSGSTVYWAHNGESTLSCATDPKRRQRQHGPSVRFKVRFSVCEQVAVAGWGRVKIGGVRYALKPITATVGPAGAKLALKPERNSRRKVLKALKQGHSAHARVWLRLTDLSRNRDRLTVDVELSR